ncbi:hypothetical protein [Bradyrhizobium sp. CB3481]|uniref:hypothetical protein n=1 Tax=Bradyrhizobium sp. CB3481 TaxID=3039158 RepID=UPI0024B04527|nr:hypothetical protein [Bradyrhizobium sp. CB3481]WFU14391.1 hypothetical protein QA643_24710 [Bradyrhizobium sp. CB3481]
MKHLCASLAVTSLLISPALADPWKDESGKGRRGYGDDRRYERSYGYYDRDYKQEYYRGPCRIERKWGKHGEYKEETKCKGYRD